VIAERLVRWILRRRWFVAIAIVIACGLAAYSARTIEIRFAFRDFFEFEGNPDVATIDRYHEYFQDPSGFVAVVVESDDAFARPTLEYVDVLTRALEPSPIFSHVRSLTNARASRWVGDSVDVGLVLPELPSTPEDAERARRVVRDSVLLHRMLVSDDGKGTVIAAQLAVAPTSSELEDLRRAIAIVHDVVDRHPPPPGMRLRITGAPVLEVAASDALLADQITFTPIAVAMIVVLLFLAFRCVHGVVLPVIAIGVATLWTAGLYPLFGRPVDMVASTIPATLLVYGAVDPIFVLRRYLDKIREGAARDDAIVAAYRELTLPCALTSITTAVGFAAFATLDLPIIVGFGRIMAIGVLLAFVTTLIVLPVLLGLLPAPVHAARSNRLEQRVDGMVRASWGWLRRNRVVVLVLTLAILIGGAVIGPRQIVSLYYTRILPPGQTESDIRYLEQHMAGVIRSAVFLEGPEDVMKRPDVLQAIERVQATAKQFAVTRVTISLADVVKEVNRAFMEGDPTEHRIPDSANLSAQYLQMLDPEDRSRLVTEDHARSHIIIFTLDTHGTAGWRPMNDAVMAAARRELSPFGITAQMTEENPAGFHVLDPLVVEMVWGFAVAFGLVVLLVGIILRSWRAMVISIVPNLVPAIACFVFTSLAGVSLRVGTVLFLSVSIGGLFNTAIQFMARVQQRIAREPDATPDEIVERSMVDVGAPALFTAVILSLGFAIFTLSRFPDLRVFGVMSMLTLLIALVADMAVTTTLTRSFWRWPRK
jgi:predicted RND superfamily exporter protein